MLIYLAFSEYRYLTSFQSGGKSTGWISGQTLPPPDPTRDAFNLRHKDAPRDLLTEEEMELLTSPLELASYKNPITEAMFKGTARSVVSEEDASKNQLGCVAAAEGTPCKAEPQRGG